MIALDKYRTCFVCVPKNGTHTIYNHLSDHGGRRVGRYHEFRWWKIPRYSFALKRYKTVMVWRDPADRAVSRSEEHTSELQSHHDLVCRLLLEKKKNTKQKGRGAYNCEYSNTAVET